MEPINSMADSPEFSSSMFELLNTPGDKRTAGLPLMGSFVWLGSILISYVIAVKFLGPWWMKNRKPFKLRKIIIVYNILQVVSNIYLFYMAGMLFITLTHWGTTCVTGAADEEQLGRYAYDMVPKVCYMYFINKVVDLLDTLFFVLTKHNDKITMLHVFHHSAMPFFTWLGTKYYPGGNQAFFGVINTFIHMIMYTYYLLAAMGPAYQKYLWWKRYLTQLQMFQFLIVSIYAIIVSFLCPSPIHTMFAKYICVMSIIFTGLFYNFYRKSYLQNSSTREVKAD